jgi:hypothetical protein
MGGVPLTHGWPGCRLQSTGVTAASTGGGGVVTIAVVVAGASLLYPTDTPAALVSSVWCPSKVASNCPMWSIVTCGFFIVRVALVSE